MREVKGEGSRKRKGVLKYEVKSASALAFGEILRLWPSLKPIARLRTGGQKGGGDHSRFTIDDLLTIHD
ncbi:MAG: hypothetical protein M3Y60_14865 [Bacteroidota bacterium]|nr:hypothetical protein [Bacteroidota bacterium]